MQNVRSLQRGLSINPGLTTWCVCGTLWVEGMVCVMCVVVTRDT